MPLQNECCEDCDNCRRPDGNKNEIPECTCDAGLCGVSEEEKCSPRNRIGHAQKRNKRCPTFPSDGAFVHEPIFLKVKRPVSDGMRSTTRLRCANNKVRQDCWKAARPVCPPLHTREWSCAGPTQTPAKSCHKWR